MTDLNRRKFSKLLGTGAVAIPLASLVNSLPSHAAAPMVDPEAANAKALMYMVESDQEGKTGSNCALYQAAGDESGGCPLFSGSSVAAGAWCSAYAPKA